MIDTDDPWTDGNRPHPRCGHYVEEHTDGPGGGFVCPPVRVEETPACYLCGRPAAGLASINDVRYCHGDGPAPTCYELALRTSAARPAPAALEVEEGPR